MEDNHISDMILTYYTRVFPAELIHRWLSYGRDAGEQIFENREFSFVLPGDVYIRYQSFGGAEEFIRQLQRRAPEKIDIGAVYNSRPKYNKGNADFQPIQKEFVLDIDLTDYDDIRTCCSSANVCPKCWKFMVVAVEILDAALRNDFGFKHLLWVFSGRRGVHCWVCDEEARFLDVSERSALIDYLSVVRGGEQQAKKVILHENIHPSIQRALGVIDKYFDTICIEEQDIFEGDAKNLAMLPAEIRKSVSEKTGSCERWSAITSWAKDKNKQTKSWNKSKIVEELKLQFCYPRLDVNVSKGLNHLLKAPFCVHPKTGRICVPFDPKKINEFDISQVPTIGQVIGEINKFTSLNTDSSAILDWKKTSVAPYIDLFIAFLDGFQGVKGQKTSHGNGHKMDF